MGKKDKKKKSNKEQHKARVAEKQERKQSRKDKKAKSKNTEEQEEDIETILANFKKEQEERVKIIEEIWSGPPSRRANATLTANPLNSNELIFFGGEFYDGVKCSFYNDLYRYNIEKDEWRRITSPNSPGPRSSHQIVITPAGTLFLFGGEFASPNETQFFHYKDFWSLDMKTNAWEKLEVKVKPSSRSGHRMTLWKHFIVLFGGFYDNYVDTRYYDDLWVFDTLEYKWTKVELPDQMIRPAARSGFSFIPCNDGIILYGGYCKEYTKGQRPKGIVHTDTWLLKMNADIKQIRWEKKKKSGSAPSARSGCAMAPYKNRAVLFGGVFDDDVSEETLESTFYNDLYTYQIDTGRWFPMNLKRPKTAKKKKPKKSKQGGAGAGGSNNQDDDTGEKREKMKWEESTDDEFDYGDFEDSENEAEKEGGTDKSSVAGAADQTGTLKEDQSETAKTQLATDKVADASKDNDGGDSTETSTKEALAAAALAAAGIAPKATPTPEAAKPEPETSKNKNSGRPSKDNDDEVEEEPLMPCPRYNPMLAVQKSTLFIYGGILEVRDREYTLDDFFSINLDKMNEYICLRQSEFESQLWLGEESDDDDDEEGEDSEDDDDEDEDEENDEDDEDEEAEDKEEEVEVVVAESSKSAKKSKKEGKDKKEPKEVKEVKEVKEGKEKKEKKDKEKKEKKEKKDKSDKATAETTPSGSAIDSSVTSSDGSKAEGATAEGEAKEEESAPEVVPSQLSGVDLAARLAMTEEEAACTPTIGETLREFYGRTTEYWVMKAFEDSTKRGKALRHDGFLLAEAKYNEWQPILAQMAQMRLDAGLDEEDDDQAGGSRPGRVLKMGEVYNKLMSRHRR
ncbi:hypothetical protein BGX34_006120 [Mortierella sp. NVP85]|nr:hypothetical protein BGX34_006120 [Mortierella sp. NVP85]